MMRISRTKRHLGKTTLFGAAILGFALAAYADPPDRHPTGVPGQEESHRKGPPERRDRPEHAEDNDRSEHDHGEHGEHAEHPEHPNAGLHLGWEQESPEQHTAKIAARRAFERQIAEAVHKDAKEVTAEERELIRMQWRRHARLWKIRELAEAAKDTASVQKCDQLIARSNAWLVAKLQDLNAKAPARGAK